MTSAITKVTWMVGLFRELNVPIHMPIIVFTNIKYAIQLATNIIFHKRTKYIKIDCYVIRDKIKAGLTDVVYVNSHE